MITKNPISAQPSKCKCGSIIEPITSGPIVVTPAECRECDAKTQLDKLEKQQRYKEFYAEAEAKKELARYEAVIPKLYWSARIEHLSPELQKKLLGTNDEQGVYLWGPVGSGKTYALAALIRYFVDYKVWVRRVVWGRLLFDIRQTFSGRGDESEIVSPLLLCNRLIIEDIGTAASMNKQESDFAVRLLLMILDARIEDCLPVFITSNLSIENLAQTFDGRIASRIQQSCNVIELRGKDRRKG